MAQLLEAIREHGPRLKLASFLRLDEIARWIGQRTTISPNLVVMVARELSWEGVSW